MEEQITKKSSLLKMIIISLILIVVTATITFFITKENIKSDKDNKNASQQKEEQTNNKNENKKEIIVGENEAFELYNLFINDSPSDNTGENVINPMEYGISKLYLSDIQNIELMNILNKALSTNERQKISDDQYEISLATLNKYSNKYFGEVINYPETIFYFPANCELKEDKYLCTKVPSGGEFQPGWMYLPIEYKTVGNELEITGVALYNDIAENYKVDKDSQEGYCAVDSTRSEKVKCAKNNKDKYAKVILKLEISENKRVFKSIEIIK